MLAPAGVHTLPHACSLDESFGKGPELGTQVWVGHGVGRKEHPASDVTYSNGMNFPMACAACAEEAGTAIVFARVLQWKSSYSLGHYEYLQEYELRCVRCRFGGGADRFTARYKLFTAGMDPEGSAFVGFRRGSGSGSGHAWGSEASNMHSNTPHLVQPAKAIGHTYTPQRRAPGESGARHRCLGDGCKRNTIRSTNYCKLHEGLARAEEAAEEAAAAAAARRR